MISFGEGIIAGFFYAIFAIVFLAKLVQEDSSNTVLYVMNGLIIAMSILLAVGNACQMGLVDQVNACLVLIWKACHAFLVPSMFLGWGTSLRQSCSSFTALRCQIMIALMGAVAM